MVIRYLATRTHSFPLPRPLLSPHYLGPEGVIPLCPYGGNVDYRLNADVTIATATAAAGAVGASHVDQCKTAANGDGGGASPNTTDASEAPAAIDAPAAMGALWEPRAMVGTAVGLRRMIRALRSISTRPRASPRAGPFSNPSSDSASYGVAVAWHQALDKDIRRTIVDYAERSVHFYAPTTTTTTNNNNNNSTTTSYDFTHQSTPEVLVALDTQYRAFDYRRNHYRDTSSSSPSSPSSSPSSSSSSSSLPNVSPSSSHGPNPSPSPGPFVRAADLADDVAEGLLAVRQFAGRTRACVNALLRHTTGDGRGDSRGGGDGIQGGSNSVSHGNDGSDGIDDTVALTLEQSLTQCLDPALRHVALNAIYGLQMEGPSGWPDMLAMLLALLRTTTLTAWPNPLQPPPLQSLPLQSHRIGHHHDHDHQHHRQSPPRPFLDDERSALRAGGAWLLLEERRALTLDYLSAPLFALGKNVRLFMANYTLAQVLVDYQLYPVPTQLVSDLFISYSNV